MISSVLCHVCVQVSSYEATGLRPMCARLANAMVGVLGPEFSLGSSHYAAAKSLITDLAQVCVQVCVCLRVCVCICSTTFPVKNELPLKSVVCFMTLVTLPAQGTSNQA